MHFDAKHVAQAGDTSEEARAKPLVRIGDRVYERWMIEPARRSANRKHGTATGNGRSAARSSVVVSPVKPSETLTSSEPISPLARSLTPQTRATSSATLRRRALAIGKGYAGPVSKGIDEPNMEINHYWEARRLDGSRDFWQFREGGRFGSHPAFDDCDDESAP